MKLAFITGANKSIGFETARQLLQKDYYVYLGSRNLKNGMDAANNLKAEGLNNVEVVQIDVADEASVKAARATIGAKTTVLDVLINNAGGLLAGSVEETAIEQGYKQFETNFWGSVKMTKAVLPMMRNQRFGKIITISSLIGLIGVPFNSYYSASKHALEGFYKSLRLELRPFDIKVSVVEPGFFKTNIDQGAQYGNESISDYEHTRKKVFQFFSESLAKSPLPKPVADVVLRIVNEKNPKYNYPVGARTRLLLAIFFS